MRYSLHTVLFVYVLSPRASFSWTGKYYIIDLGNPVLKQELLYFILAEYKYLWESAPKFLCLTEIWWNTVGKILSLNQFHVVATRFTEKYGIEKLS